MAQSNHHPPGTPAGDEERPACGTSGSARQRRSDPPASTCHGVGATRVPVTTQDYPRIAGVHVCDGQARP